MLAVGHTDHLIAASVNAADTGADLRRALGGLGVVASDPPRHTAQCLSVERNGRWQSINDTDRLIDVGLCHGDRIALRHRPPAPTVVRPRWRLGTTAGASAGTAQVLTVGRHELTDGSTLASFSVGEPAAAELRIESCGTVTARPPTPVSPSSMCVTSGSSLCVNGVPISRPRTLTADDTLRLGATAWVLRPISEPALSPAGHLGTMPFHRSPSRRTIRPTTRIQPIDDVPARPTPRRFQALAALAPLAMGIALAVMMASPRFLLFALLTPVIAVASHIDHRRHAGAAWTREVDRFAAALRDHAATITGEVDAWVEEEHRAAPDIDAVIDAATSRSDTLWSRGPHHPGFLHTRLGLGDRAPAMQIEPCRSGDREHRLKVEDAHARATRPRSVPVTLDLTQHAALIGRHDQVTRLARSLLVQLAVAHSPLDVRIVALVHPRRGLAPCVGWLPHVRSTADGGTLAGVFPGVTVATTTAAGDATLRALGPDAQPEEASLGGGRPSVADDRTGEPHTIVVVDELLGLNGHLLDEVLHASAASGVRIVWLGRQASGVPHRIGSLVSCDGSASEVRNVHEADGAQSFILEGLGSCAADRAARALAPLTDATAGRASAQIPNVCTLFDALGGEPDVGSVLTRWGSVASDNLRAPVGMDGDGPVAIDLVGHGPHTLIGGTSGSGKSELVQTLVTALALEHSPERLNVLFIDYKGGALSEQFASLPHTVGSVTNLDPALAGRALTSLTAELDRRMGLLQGRARDLTEMIARHPEAAPPRLLIVVDEFASLVRELPAFIDGVVSIAERGRSLGIHLLLATQRPSGAINENIAQNTNLRIALRMLDAGESTNVIGTAAAASIRPDRRGRGFVRLGAGQLAEFQTAWGGAPLVASTENEPLVVRLIADPGAAAREERIPSSAANDAPLRSQQDHALSVVARAAADLDVVPGRRPWRPTLPTDLSLATALEAPAPPAVAPQVSDRSDDTRVSAQRAAIVIGMLDDPANQAQYRAEVDLGDTGPVAVFGSTGSGRSTVLRTAAHSFVRSVSDAAVFGIDVASHDLTELTSLSECRSVATGDDLEAVTRTIALLAATLDRRRAGTGAWGPSPPEPEALLLIDGYESLTATLEALGATGLEWNDKLTDLLRDGRRVGLHIALTVGRRADVRSNVLAAISNRVVLRQAEESAYGDFGVPTEQYRGATLASGQGWFQGLGFQAARVEAPSDPTTGACSDPRHPPGLTTSRLPVAVQRTASADERPGWVSLGLADVTGRPVQLNVHAHRLAVVGPGGSGRSSVLMSVTDQLVAQRTRVWVLASQRSPLRHCSVAQRCCGAERHLDSGSDDLARDLEALALEAESFPDAPITLVVDDADRFDDRALAASFARIVDSPIRLVGSLGTRRGVGMNPLVAELKAGRATLLLQPEDANDAHEHLGRRIPLRPGLQFPPGRGILRAEQETSVLQCWALPSERRATPDAGAHERPHPTGSVFP